MTRVLVVLILIFGPLRARVADLAAPPVFFAVSVPSLEASVKWYTENLDLVPVRLPASPKAKVALLKGHGALGCVICGSCDRSCDGRGFGDAIGRRPVCRRRLDLGLLGGIALDRVRVVVIPAAEAQAAPQSKRGLTCA